MKKILNSVMKALLISTLCVVALSGTVLAEDGTIIDIEVSPQVLNIESNSRYVHIHADIGFGIVEDTNVEVNKEEIEVKYAFADDCGNLVVICDIEEVKEIVKDDESANFVLTCNGGDYTGWDSVPVIRVIPQKP